MKRLALAAFAAAAHRPFDCCMKKLSYWMEGFFIEN
jgi:hypothetical protein